jgi:hypothetical protein
MTLAPEELAGRLDRLLGAAQARLRAVSASVFEREPGTRDLGYQLFRGALACVEAMDRGRFDERALLEQAPPDLNDGAALARYGALVRGRLAGWFEGAGRDEYAATVDTERGVRTGHQLVEQAVLRAARDLGRLYVVLDRLGVPSDIPFPTDVVADLPQSQE